MALPTQGKLADHPLGELIRELGAAGATGALRLSRDRAKVVVYFDLGKPIFAASNIRAHRLSEFLKRSDLVDVQSLAQIPATATDEEVLKLLTTQGKIKADQSAGIRSNLVNEILRATLLWTAGDWEFDARVKLAGDLRVVVDVQRLLLESTRHLPATYIASRFTDTDEQLQMTQTNSSSPTLLPSEAFVASRLSTPMTIAELQTISGLGPDETLRAVYALAMSGAITRSGWEPANGNEKPQPPKAAAPEPKSETVEEFVTRVEKAPNFYAVLNIDQRAATPEIKNAYHGLARRYHPDRFHQADAALRAKIESAFARVARAYETLTHASSRSAYDAQMVGTKGPELSSQGAPDTARTVADARAAASYQNAMTALKQNQSQQAVRFLAEAAHLEPRCARYRAEYGRALTADPQTRRIAEIELKAAIALEPKNASYRVMLGELYQALGLRRRAEAELQRALLADPKSETARTLLANLKK